MKRPTTSPDGDVRSRWEWTEPYVWTKRMLTALENGVRGGRWHSLNDKVYAPKNLKAAAEKVVDKGGAAGVDHVTAETFAKHMETNLERLEEHLRAGTYRPQSIRRVFIPKPGSKERRPLGIPTIRDRVVQMAAKHVLEPIFERDFAAHSYGFRPGRSCKDALRRVDALLKEGYSYIVDADLKSYFDTIPHEKLMNQVAKKVSDRRMLHLIEQFLQQGVLGELPGHEPVAGTPQGAVISPLLSNIYLDGLDHLMAARGYEMVRYADDFIVLCRSEEEAHAAMDVIAAWVEDAGLKLHPEKTRITTEHQGFDFLGYHFRAGRRTPSRKSLKKFKATVRAKTKRTNGRSLMVIIKDLNQTLRGWYAYFKHSRWRIFKHLDQWIRIRLRTILRKRHGGSGIGKGFDHMRWPNAYFARHGLFSLKRANDLDRQSSRR